MTATMTAKEYLNSLRSLDLAIKVKDDKLHYLKQKIAYAGSQTISERVSSSTSNNSMFSVEQIVDLENKIKSDRDDLLYKQLNAIKIIEKLHNDKYEAILMQRYIRCESWENIIDFVGYGRSHTFQLHKEAIKEFEKFF